MFGGQYKGRGPLTEIKDPQPHWDQFVDLVCTRDGRLDGAGILALERLIERAEQKLNRYYEQGAEVENDGSFYDNRREVLESVFLIRTVNGHEVDFDIGIGGDRFEEIEAEVEETGFWPGKVEHLMLQWTRHYWGHLLMDWFIDYGKIPSYWVEISEGTRERMLSDVGILGGYVGDRHLASAEAILREHPSLNTFADFYEAVEGKSSDLDMEVHENPGDALRRTLQRRIEESFGKPAWTGGFKGFRKRILEISGGGGQ